MTPLSARSRIIRKSEDLVLFAPGPSRRIMFSLLFLLLAVAMALGLDPEADFSGLNLLKTIGYAAALLVLFGAAGWSNVTSFDRGTGSVETTAKIFGLTVRSRLLVQMNRIEGVVLQRAKLLPGGASAGGRSGVFGNLFEPRSQLIRLFLETDLRRIRIDEADNADQLEETGTYLAEFLGVEFSREELESGR